MRTFYLPWVLVLLLSLTLVLNKSALAIILPYSARTNDFSPWTPAIRGDINTIGMAGATVALPMTISAAEYNPAGFAMLTSSVSAQFNTVKFNDSSLQHSGEPIESRQWGLGVTPNKWGFSLAYYSPLTESGTYVSPNTGDTVQSEVSLQELRLTTARNFFDGALALGASLRVFKAVRKLNDFSSNAFGESYALGGLYRLPQHFVLGLSYFPASSVGPASNADPQTILPGFNRTVASPMQLSMGGGWIPNRFFKMGVSLIYVGRTENTALLADQRISSGLNPTWVPRVGASYVLADFKDLKLEFALGSYFETSRISNHSNRLHITSGLETNPSFINLGVGFDLSNGYQNLIVAVGVDMIRALREFQIIPKDAIPPTNRFWPSMTKISGDGLPSGLLNAKEKEKSSGGHPSVKEVEEMVREAPEKLRKRFKGESVDVDLGDKIK